MRPRRIADKQWSRERAIEIVRDWKAAGERVVFANGVFDLVHVGHVRYLRAARAAGTRLVVGVNGDRTAAGKGPGRPVLPADERAALVGALDCVDGVVIFEEPTADAILEALRPDVHAKGTDYAADTVPEAATARAIGATIAIVGDAKERASSGLVERIRELVERVRGRPGASSPSGRAGGSPNPRAEAEP